MDLNDIVSYPKLQDYIKENKISEDKVKKIYKEIAANYNTKTLSKLEKVFDLTFAKLYESINLTSDVNVLELSKKYHLILVPNHQSYADFLGISYAFYKKVKLPIYIAAGINLNIYPLGNIFRKGGAFFIRRSFREDFLYKYTLEAYIYNLLKEQRVIKFYFEGGRSRTGKLLPPKYGLFLMLLESYSVIKSDKEICFLPISISHEYLPESKSHRAEIFGSKKKQESSTQLFKIFKVFNKNLGSIHLRVGDPILISTVEDDVKKQIQDLAFKCFRSVGKGVMVSPTSLLSMVLLDNIHGALTKEDILISAKNIIKYCKDFSVPLSPNLEKNTYLQVIESSLNLMVENKKVELIKNDKLQKTFYNVLPENRVDLLYLKNTILHHFLIPLFMSGAWINVFRGSIDSTRSLRAYYLEQRKLLKHEFYLPEPKEMFDLIKEIIKKTLGLDSFSFDDSLNLSKSDFYKLGEVVSPFTYSFSYIYEAYYVSALTLKALEDKKFDFDTFSDQAKEVFKVESTYGKLIRFPESFSVPLMKSSMDYFIGQGIVSVDANEFNVSNDSKSILNRETERLVTILSDFTSLNIKSFK